ARPASHSARTRGGCGGGTARKSAGKPEPGRSPVDETPSDKQFELHLEELELRPGKSAAAVAREHGLDIQRLYVLYCYALMWRHDDLRVAAEIGPFRDAAGMLRNAANAVRFIARLHMPSFEDFAGAQARIDARLTA